MSASHQVAGAVAESPGVDFLPLKGTDHIEFYVGNARQAAYFYRTAFGMSLTAYAGPETGQRDRASYVVQQGKIRFVLTTSLRSESAIADHVHRHGDAVRAIALWVDDARQAWQETTRRGATSVAEPLRAAGRARRGHPGQHPDLRRHDSHFCRARELLWTVPARIPEYAAATQSPVLWAFCTSIIWSAMWAGTIWTGG